MSTFTENICMFVNRLEFDSIPEKILQKAKLHILDGMGTAIVSTTIDKSKRIMSTFRDLSGRGEATVWAYGKSSPLLAATVNGALIEGLDYSDIHVEAGLHPTCVVLPALFALGEWRRSSGRTLLASYVAGCEAMVRLGLAAPGGFHGRGFQPTSAVGVIASALASGKLLRLSEEKLINAVSIASTLAFGSSLSVRVGAYFGGVDPGRAAESGMTAALLAEKGVSGIAADSLEGEYGLLEVYSDHSARNRIPTALDGLAREWRFGETFLKRYPTSYACTFMIDAALRIRSQHRIDPSEMEQVSFSDNTQHLKLFSEPAEQKMNPRNVYEAKTSHYFLISLALICGEVSLRALSANLDDSGVLGLARRTKYVADEKYHWVEVTLRSGEKVRESQDELVQTSEDFVLRKFDENTIPLIGKARAAMLQSLLRSLERVKDLRALARLTTTKDAKI